MKSLIVAGSKPWNKKFYQKIYKDKKYKWHFVSSPRELNKTLKKVINPLFLFFLHWNWKVSKKIITNFECVCFHMTDLPYGRGGSPLQNLILNKKKYTKLSAFKMNDEMDAGPIYTKKRMSLKGKAEEIYKRADKISWEIIKKILKNQPKLIPQKNKPFYFKRRKPAQSLLPLRGNLNNIYDFIRMLDAPTYPRAFIDHGNFKLELSDFKLKNNMLEGFVVIKKNK